MSRRTLIDTDNDLEKLLSMYGLYSEERTVPNRHSAFFTDRYVIGEYQVLPGELLANHINGPGEKSYSKGYILSDGSGIKFNMQAWAHFARELLHHHGIRLHNEVEPWKKPECTCVEGDSWSQYFCHHHNPPAPFQRLNPLAA